MPGHRVEEFNMRIQEDAGLGLVELIIAMLLLGVISIALLPGLWQAISLSVQQSASATATRHVNTLVEQARTNDACSSLESMVGDQTIVDGADNPLAVSVSMSPESCTPNATVTLVVNVVDGSGDTLASATALVFASQ
jgi:type II secretory pathway pseudopilin PulG